VLSSFGEATFSAVPPDVSLDFTSLSTLSLTDLPTPLLLSCKSINFVHSSSMNFEALLSSTKPVISISMSLPSGSFSARCSWIDSDNISSSFSSTSLIFCSIQGFKLLMSILDTFSLVFKMGEKFNSLSNFLCLFANLLSWSAEVPRKKPASVIFVLEFAFAIE